MGRHARRGDDQQRFSCRSSIWTCWLSPIVESATSAADKLPNYSEDPSQPQSTILGAQKSIKPCTLADQGSHALQHNGAARTQREQHRITQHNTGTRQADRPTTQHKHRSNF